MKPLTAANKLGIYLPAAPEEFQRSALTRDELDALRADPPAWLVELRRTGPFPRDVVAQKLGISRSGLARGEVGDALDADQIGALSGRPAALAAAGAAGPDRGDRREGTGPRPAFVITACPRSPARDHRLSVITDCH